MFFRRFPTDLPQLYLLALFAANGGLGGRSAFQGVALRFLAIVAHAMTVKGDNQRQAVGGDQLDAVFIVDMLFPERRQMNFNRIEEIAPFIWRVGGDPVAGDGACHRIDGITLFVQRQSDRRAGRTGRRHLLGVAQLGNILLNSLALIRRKLPRGSVAKGVQ